MQRERDKQNEHFSVIGEIGDKKDIGFWWLYGELGALRTHVKMLSNLLEQR